jgi:copper homeostasis protein
MPSLEVCVESVVSALAAIEGGADRVELCANLAVGGITPSAGTIAVACRRVPAPVHVLIRPRGSDFVYDDHEFEVMCHDVETVNRQGAMGVVLGILDRDGSVDRERVSILSALAHPMSLTFHKAFDETLDPFGALDVLLSLGFERVLTSGQAPTAREGLPLLTRLSRYADGRIAIMAGGRVRPGDLEPLVQAGVREIHVGSAVVMGNEVDVRKVRDLVSALREM